MKCCDEDKGNKTFSLVLSPFNYHTLLDMTISGVIRLKSLDNCVKYDKIIRRLPRGCKCRRLWLQENGKQTYLQIQCTPDLVTHLVCQKTVTKSRGVTK